MDIFTRRVLWILLGVGLVVFISGNIWYRRFNRLPRQTVAQPSIGGEPRAAGKSLIEMNTLAGGALMLSQAGEAVEGIYQLDAPASQPFAFTAPGHLVNACRFRPSISSEVVVITSIGGSSQGYHLLVLRCGRSPKTLLKDTAAPEGFSFFPEVLESRGSFQLSYTSHGSKARQTYAWSEESRTFVKLQAEPSPAH